MTVDCTPTLPLVPFAALAPERATPFGPHRPLPGISLTERDVRESAGDVRIEKTV
jgi:hypothetical protein